MKTLDASSLHEGIEATLQEIKQVQSKVTDMQKGVRGVIDLESYGMNHHIPHCRSHWVTYAFGTFAASVVGTKGAGTVNKVGTATAKAGSASNTVKNADLSWILPYAPQYQLAGGARVPLRWDDISKRELNRYSTFDEYLKDSFQEAIDNME